MERTTRTSPSLHLPFQRSTDISLEAVGNIRKLMHPSALPAGSCKQESYCWPQHTDNETLGGCRSYTRHGSAVGSSGCKVYKLPHRGSPTQHRLARLCWFVLLGFFFGWLLSNTSQHSYCHLLKVSKPQLRCKCQELSLHFASLPFRSYLQWQSFYNNTASTEDAWLIVTNLYDSFAFFL